jgi:hypothetical protein
MMQLLNSCSPRAQVVPDLELFVSRLSREIALLQAPKANLDLALSSVVRELARLQIQVEILQQQIDDLQASGPAEAVPDGRLSVVREIG